MKCFSHLRAPLPNNRAAARLAVQGCQRQPSTVAGALTNPVAAEAGPGKTGLQLFYSFILQAGFCSLATQ